MSQSYSGVNSNLLIDVETQLGLSIYDVKASLTTGLKQLSSLTSIYTGRDSYTYQSRLFVNITLLTEISAFLIVHHHTTKK